MGFHDGRLYWISRRPENIQGHWILAFAGKKAEVEEICDCVLTAKEDLYGEDYPDFACDFGETKQFFVKKKDQWTPCEWEDCKEKDPVLPRAHSLAPCDIERMEGNSLFFNLVDDADTGFFTLELLGMECGE